METRMTPVGDLARLIFDRRDRNRQLGAVNLSLREGSTAFDLFSLCLDLFMTGVLILRGTDRFALHELTVGDFESVRDDMKVLGVLARFRTDELDEPVSRACTSMVRPASANAPLDRFRVAAFCGRVRYELWFEVFHHTVFASCASVRSVSM